MRHKVVIWGTNAENEKVLIALELQAEANKVLLHTFPESVANEEFVNKMMKDWRTGKEVEFPEGHSTLERELSVTESLLPENLKVDRADVIQQAQTEWHFAVLSAKLHQAYVQELADFKEKVAALSAYDFNVFQSLKGFWDKVQDQSRSRNLFREHADGLRDGINALFEDLKLIRNRVQGELHEASQKIYDEFNAAVDAVEAKLENSNTRVAGLFDELKQLQQKYRDSKFTNEHRNKFFNRIDEAFKKVKERRFGGSADDGSLVERHNRRLTGLHEAIKRMQHTIKLDEEDLAFQQKKVNTTEGQLEAQIRMAKIKMIEERLAGKREKLADMQQTITDIERQIGRAKEGEQKRAERVAKQQRFDEAKEAAKNEIAKDIRTRGKGDAKEEDNIFEAAGTVLGDVLMDALDTMKAVASVMAEKAEDAMDDVAKKVEEMAEVIMKKEEEAPAKTSTEETVALESTGSSDDGDNIIEDVVHREVAEAPAEESVAADDKAKTKKKSKKDEAEA